MSRSSIESVVTEEDSDVSGSATAVAVANEGHDGLPSPDHEATEDVDDSRPESEHSPIRRRRRDAVRSRRAILGRWVLPALALTLVLAAAWLKWQTGIAHDADTARAQSVQAATDGAVAILSYQPDTVDKDLDAARARLTGQFRDSYTSLTRDVVAPGAKEKKVSAAATAPAAASITASPTHAVVLVFVDQTTIVDNSAPTSIQSSVQVTLDRIDGRWLISGFDPV